LFGNFLGGGKKGEGKSWSDVKEGKGGANKNTKKGKKKKNPSRFTLTKRFAEKKKKKNGRKETWKGDKKRGRISKGGKKRNISCNKFGGKRYRRK